MELQLDEACKDLLINNESNESSSSKDMKMMNLMRKSSEMSKKEDGMEIERIEKGGKSSRGGK